MASKANASEKATRVAFEIEKKAIDIGLAGRNLMTLAAAAVYTACLDVGESKTWAAVADAAGVAETTLRSCAKAMRKLTFLSIPATL